MSMCTKEDIARARICITVDTPHYTRLYPSRNCDECRSCVVFASCLAAHVADTCLAGDAESHQCAHVSGELAAIAPSTSLAQALCYTADVKACEKCISCVFGPDGAACDQCELCLPFIPCQVRRASMPMRVLGMPTQSHSMQQAEAMAARCASSAAHDVCKHV